MATTSNMCVCMTRNQEEAHGQEGEDTKREELGEELRKKLQPPDDRSGPDVRRQLLQGVRGHRGGAHQLGADVVEQVARG